MNTSGKRQAMEICRTYGGSIIVPKQSEPQPHFFSDSLVFGQFMSRICAELPNTLQFDTSNQYEVTVGSYGTKTLTYDSQDHVFKDPTEEYVIGELTSGGNLIGLLTATPGTYQVIIDEVVV